MSWHQRRDLLQSLQALRHLCRDEALVLGNGSLLQQLSDRLHSLLGPAAPGFQGHDYRSCRLQPSYHYIIADSPADDIAETLVRRGIEAKRVIHADRLMAITIEAANAAEETRDLWLECTHCQDLTQLYSIFDYTLANHQLERVFHWLDRILSLSSSPAQALGNLVLRFAQRPEFLQQLEVSRPLAERAATRLAEFQPPPRSKNILLYPSGGRCGGNSIHYALEAARPRPLRGGHEAMHVECYTLLQLSLRHPQTSSLCRVALLALLSENDALGGNPACFLLPYALSLPGFRFTLLHVRRDRANQLESILRRNFHYSDADTVPNRVTAVDYGESSDTEWEALSRQQKVEWYLDKVEHCIRSARSQLAYFEAPIQELDSRLDSVLREAGFAVRTQIQHLNTAPSYRSFSAQELAFLYRHFQSKELHHLPAAQIEAALQAFDFSKHPHP